ncbi:hypothetical protein A2U01_0043498 [Trifolium medium]|uniref:Uncharacterized protein n=1 Tax=Trifolium medium TaxID=97028 RepID=A0A392QEP6_9FABA|nr:hypothetical protein [Trifolium medium]
MLSKITFGILWIEEFENSCVTMGCCEAEWA